MKICYCQFSLSLELLVLQCSNSRPASMRESRLSLCNKNMPCSSAMLIEWSGTRLENNEHSSSVTSGKKCFNIRITCSDTAFPKYSWKISREIKQGIGKNHGQQLMPNNLFLILYPSSQHYSKSVCGNVPGRQPFPVEWELGPGDVCDLWSWRRAARHCSSHRPAH